MIASLRGTLIYSDNASIIIECGGVGFKALATSATLNRLPQKGEEVFVYTYMAVREDAMDLYAFTDLDELEAFKMLTSVNGVGAKMGIALLSDVGVSQIILAISTGDSKTLTRANGVGPKLAQRIVLELKDKVGASVSDDLDDAVSVVASAGDDKKEAISALVSLGYSSSEAQKAVAKCKDSVGVEQMIKEALKYLF